MDVVQRMKKALRRGRSVELPPGTLINCVSVVGWGGVDYLLPMRISHFNVECNTEYYGCKFDCNVGPPEHVLWQISNIAIVGGLSARGY